MIKSIGDTDNKMYSEEEVKLIAVQFYFFWHSTEGADIAEGFISWWKDNKANNYIPEEAIN